MSCPYKISIETSDAFLDTGTDSTVYIQLVARDGKTETHWQKLDLPWHNDFEPGATDVYTVTFIDVGLPSVIRIRLKGWFGMKDEWLCNKIEVCRDGETVTFPIYDYITSEAEYACGEAKIPQKEANKTIRQLRRKEIQNNKTQFAWLPKDVDLGYKGFPRYLNADEYEDLPKIFRRYFLRNKEIQANKLKGVISMAVGKIRSFVNDVSDFDEYDKLSKVLGGDRGDYLKGWDTDEGQGWQMLNGILPLLFEKMTKIPSYFNITDEDVKHLLGDGRTLDGEMANDNLYITDLTEYFGKEWAVERTILPNGEPCTCPAAVGLFHIGEAGKFMPIAIQLVPNDRDYLFTSDGTHDWMLAKMYFRCATSNVHEWIYHFLYTHNTIEPFACSVFRCLSRTHPVYKLLRPHLLTLPAINTVSRHVLLTPESSIAPGMAIISKSFIRKKYQQYNINDVFIPKVLSKQGLDPEKIPQYWYGKDATSVWNITGNYIRSILKLYYSCDKDVIEDQEIQDWAYENAHEAFGWEDGNTRGIPDKFQTLEQLADLCTIILTTSSAQHAAVNFGQFETYRFPPNCPGIMRLPCHKKGEANMERIMASLPDGNQATLSVGLTYAISQYVEIEEILGSFVEYWFTDEKALEVQRKFKQDLVELEKQIDARNAQLERKYEFLKPSRIPNSIAI